MTLANIKVGDVVHVDKRGRRFYAIVTSKHIPVGAVVAGAPRKGLMIAPLCRETYHFATAREVVGHYRKAKGSA